MARASSMVSGMSSPKRSPLFWRSVWSQPSTSAGGAPGRAGAGTGGRLNLGKVHKIQSGHVPESLRRPSDAPGQGRGSSRPR